MRGIDSGPGRYNLYSSQFRLVPDGECHGTAAGFSREVEEDMIARIPISRAGYQKMREELDRLERYERFDVVRAIEEARQHGDLSENAEYHAAKERQGMIEGRIMELKDKIARAEVIDCTKVNCNSAVFGTVVTLLDMETEEKMTYQLLGPEEADVKSGSISVLSPLGRSLLGKTIGDDVMAKTPGGLREFEVMDITVPTRG